MDCCNYGQYGAGAGAGAGPGWEAYGGAGAYPAQYAPYAHAYYAPHAHDPYARYYRYDYQPHHMHHAEHTMPIDYGAYAAKEVRARRAVARREQFAHTPAQHLPLPPTPPLDMGMNGRGPSYGEPQMWSHYQQMGVMNAGWNGSHAAHNNEWSRSSCSRERMRYSSDCRQMKTLPMPAQTTICHQDGKTTPYPVYDDSPSTYSRDNPVRHGNSDFIPAASTHENTRYVKERAYPEARPSPPVEKRPPVVPLPAFQQAFGSTEIGKFSEAFSRTEVAQDDASSDNFLYDTYSEWDGPTEPQWSTQPAAREIKCEDNY